MADSEYTRLHITPCTPALLNSILPASILPNARNISYHSIQTLPEKGFGYVELPTMDAEKVKKRLSGSTLKGHKIRIEKAKPQKEIVIEAPEPEQPKRVKTKRKRDELPGADIGERSVKRGWTTPAKDIVKGKEKEKKVVNKSKYTTGPECLFKMNLPPNVASKSKSTEKKVDAKRKRKAGREMVVHEFAKTTKYANFLRGSGGSGKAKGVAEFVEGKGWVDEDGNVVEEIKLKKKRKHKQSTPEPIPEPADDSSSSSEPSRDEEEVVGEKVEAVGETGAGADSDSESSGSDDGDDELVEDPDAMDVDGKLGEARSSLPIAESSDGSSASESSDDSSGSDDDNPILEEVKPDGLEVKKTEKAASVDSTSSSSSDDSSDEDSDDAEIKEVAENVSESSESSSSSSSSEEESEAEKPQLVVTSRPHSSAGPALSITIPASNNSTPIPTFVHPLEALYKKPKIDVTASSPKPTTSFSFFGGDDIDDEDEAVITYNQAPLTPYRQKDIEFRRSRSAAPTPDTAHINKKFIWPIEEEKSSPTKGKASESKAEQGGEAESEFQKWFWENRGNVDRSWKARRRAVGKEKRQGENRKRNDRI